MNVAGGKLGETKRTHRIGWQGACAPAGRMKLAVQTTHSPPPRRGKDASTSPLAFPMMTD